MTRAKFLLGTCALMLAGLVAPASAAPFTSSGHEAKSQVQKIDYRRCWIEDGEEVCRYFAEDYYDPDDDYEDDDVYAYDPGPPVILGFGIGAGRHHGHGGHGGHGNH